MKQTHRLKAMGNAAAIVAGSRSIAEAARKLNVNRSSVHRWIASGSVPRPTGRRQRPATATAAGCAGAAVDMTPAAWAADVRERYALTATEAQLVALAERALTLAQDPATPAAVQLAAMGRYQRLVQQLDLEEEAAADGEVEEATAASRPWPRRVG